LIDPELVPDEIDLEVGDERRRQGRCQIHSAALVGAKMREERRSLAPVSRQATLFMTIIAQPAAREFVNIAQVMVDPHGELIVFVRACVRAVEKVEEALRIARLVGQRDILEDLPRQRVDPLRTDDILYAIARNDVTYELPRTVGIGPRGIRVIDLDWLAAGVECPGEIATALFQRGHGAGFGRWDARNDLLPREHKKGLVSPVVDSGNPDRPVDDRAGLIPAEGRALRAGGVVLE
jgi:hypothetical protein